MSGLSRELEERSRASRRACLPACLPLCLPGLSACPPALPARPARLPASVCTRARAGAQYVHAHLDAWRASPGSRAKARFRKPPPREEKYQATVKKLKQQLEPRPQSTHASQALATDVSDM